MSKLATKIERLHSPMDNSLLKALSLALGFLNAGLVLWNPEVYNQAIGGFNAVIAPALIWAICSSVIYGVGFKPRNWYWQILFSPYFSLTILVYLTISFFM
ncbi:cyd operon protein YbgE [Vibrio azureus]|uniref:cyd operon protein YbgE n=1 Tax=Vibrio azureus TaxID=512649 RepID=UPI000518D2E4|nr:cyd operon protein YbgE [Vibrio azureus]AUI85814.1 cyd operon protein YbgE [Vibrio azureus]